MRWLNRWLGCALVCGCLQPVFLWAFDGHLVTREAIQLEIGEFPPPVDAESVVEVPVSIRADGSSGFRGDLTLHGLVDEWRSVGPRSAVISVGPGDEQNILFRLRAEPGVERALYPVHITLRDEDGGEFLHAVRVFESRIPKRIPSTPEPIVVPPVGTVDLSDAGLSRVTWEVRDGTPGKQPRGWTGSDPETGTERTVGAVDRGGVKRALRVHPPYRTGPGTMRCEYRVRLPDAEPITLSYATAVRDPDDQGRAGDGITFRVRIAEAILAERHHDSRTWTPETVDLTPWQGQTITIALETSPGPDRKTAFDLGYWGEPVLRVGSMPRRATEAEIEALERRAEDLLEGDQVGNDPAIILAKGARAVLLPGPNGLIDGEIGFSLEGRSVRFRGLEIALHGSLLGGPDASSRVENTRAERLSRGGWRFVHRCRDATGPFDLTLAAQPAGDALKLKADCSRRITRLALGPARQHAPRIYGGHGYVIEEPGAMTLPFRGHGLAASHVAVDFEDGLTLLTASDHPPVAFEIDPADRRYSLVTPYDATLTFVPGTKGGLEAAVRYRPHYDKTAAPGVPAKAGRFVFDIWGGPYRDITQLMRGAIDYGLRDAMLTVHSWQRWGYDYRLPDIFPPNPRLGTLEDLQELSRLCREHDIPWGLHDNYIDFYPDAEDFSYERICFNEEGKPVKAWLNESRDARSYRWRPDAFRPFLVRNLEQIVPALQPTQSFVDVFSALPPVEYHTRDGSFHTALETRRHWGEAFATIREALHGPAITTSEAGHDQLTGYLDGADCQFLQLAAEPGKFLIKAPCADWERIPWMDAVLHDRFILHGVGYSSRYQGGRSRLHHGIESDDYIGAEILTGHALMIDRTAGLTGAVRKYWLAQPVARALALDSIAEAGWQPGNLHRLRVKWLGGMEVHVNRDSEDWSMADFVLPPFGFVADDGAVRAAVERIDGHVVEHSRWPGGFYVNSRTRTLPGAPLPVTPRAGEFRAMGERAFRLPLRWTAAHPLERDARVFVHVVGAEELGGERIVAQGDHNPDLPTTQWQGEVVSGSQTTIRLPADLGPGEYPIVVGLHAGGPRLSLRGESFDLDRYLVGSVQLDRGGNLSFRPSDYLPPPPLGNPPGTLIDFGLARTDGAFRADIEEDTLTVTPLPDSETMKVTLRLPEGWSDRPTRTVEVLRRDGVGGDLIPTQTGVGTLSFTTRPGDFAYRLRK